MKLKLTKLMASLLIFLLCVNIHGLMSIFLNVEKSTSITYQDVSFLNTNIGSGSLILKVGKTSGPNTLEPVDCWDSWSRDVIEQVVETLFTYDFSNPELPRVNELAETYWWEDTTTLQITLKQSIFFHDDTPFNALAAKWNLDRLLYLTNCTGTNTGDVAHTRSLWLFPDGVTPIIASVSAVGNWNITINLNAPFAPLLDLLCYINAGMLSPSSTPATEFIDLSTGQLIGTGPFKYDYYTSNTEVKFTRWDNYWKTPAYFEEMLFIIYSDATTAHNAMLAYEIDILDTHSSQNLPLYDADPNITVKRFTEDTGKPSLVYYYLGFNNHKYNRTWRKAMSHAINYTFIIEDLKLGNAIRANSPISPGFGASYNASATAAAYNITQARQIMVSMGFGNMGWTDAQWISVAEGATPFAEPIYTYNTGNTFRTDLGVAITDWFKLIGVAVIDEGVEWSVFLYYLFHDYDHLEIFSIRWAPDYLEPFNMIDPIFNPASSSNSAQVNDTYLNTQMALALNTTDDTARNNIYKDIQRYMAEIGYFHAYFYHPEVTYVHLNEIKGVPYNAMDIFYAYPIYSVAPGPFTLSSDAEDPDPDGNFTLSWTESLGADNYTVYRHSSYITAINGTLTVLASGITETNLTISNLFLGTHYFIVEALNASGNTLSNCIKIDVEVINPNWRSPIFDGLFLNYTFSMGIQSAIISASYTYISGNTFLVNETTMLMINNTVISMYYGSYKINNQTRQITEIGYYHIFYGTYPPYNGEGDHQFNITGETTLSLPGLGDFDAWVLKDLTEPNTHALYDKATGILLNGTFFYGGGLLNYSLTLQATNLFESPTEPPRIPGYSPLYIIGVIIISSYMLIRKRKKTN